MIKIEKEQLIKDIYDEISNEKMTAFISRFNRTYQTSVKFNELINSLDDKNPDSKYIMVMTMYLLYREDMSFSEMDLYDLPTLSAKVEKRIAKYSSEPRNKHYYLYDYIKSVYYGSFNSTQQIYKSKLNKDMSFTDVWNSLREVDREFIKGILPHLGYNIPDGALGTVLADMFYRINWEASLIENNIVIFSHILNYDVLDYDSLGLTATSDLYNYLAVDIAEQEARKESLLYIFKTLSERTIYYESEDTICLL